MAEFNSPMCFVLFTKTETLIRTLHYTFKQQNTAENNGSKGTKEKVKR